MYNFSAVLQTGFLFYLLRQFLLEKNNFKNKNTSTNTSTKKSPKNYFL